MGSVVHYMGSVVHVYKILLLIYDNIILTLKISKSLKGTMYTCMYMVSGLHTWEELLIEYII